jgi:hypothetical protein
MLIWARLASLSRESSAGGCVILPGALFPAWTNARLFLSQLEEPPDEAEGQARRAKLIDIESSVSQKVSQVEVYKVHHHGSRYSSNKIWLSVIKPRIGIISTGVGNTYGHPTEECLDRLHAAGVKTYWTSAGNGVAPDAGNDVIGGDIIVESAPNSSTFTVAYHGGGDPDTLATR